MRPAAGVECVECGSGCSGREKRGELGLLTSGLDSRLFRLHICVSVWSFPAYSIPALVGVTRWGVGWFVLT